MSVLATYLILLSGCDRNDLCYDHPHENLHVAVVWDSAPAELQTSLPEGVRISIYAVQQARQEQSGANYTYYRDTYGGDVTVQNGTAKVDFSKEFARKFTGGSTGEEMLVGSIVDTLTEFPEVKQVQFLIEGQPVETIAGHMDTTAPIRCMKELIAK